MRDMSWVARQGPLVLLVAGACASVAAGAQAAGAARSNGTRPEPEPPPYARTPGAIGLDVFRGLDWLDVGLDFRSRLEFHDNDFARKVEARELPLLVRVRAFLGVKRVLDPLRFTVELEDARRYNGAFPLDDRDVNVVEPIQLYGELYFGEAAGAALPVSVRLGRMAFELVDRRLVARNNWRNTTNTFQGGRAVIGDARSAVHLDVFALQPLQRLLYELDQPVPGQGFFGAVATLRPWAPWVTVQPYWLAVTQAARAGAVERELHSPALRAFGLFGDTGLDFDVSTVAQFGRDGPRAHLAFGAVGELGFTVPSLWNARASATWVYATGDRDPNDAWSGRLDRLFGFARPFSNNLTFGWENLHAGKTWLEVKPHARVSAAVGYGAYWLASATDRWNAPGLRDPTGQSGTFLGHEVDVQLRTTVLPVVDVNVGYAFFTPGEFPRNLGRRLDTHFLYVELNVRALP